MKERGLVLGLENGDKGEKGGNSGEIIIKQRIQKNEKTESQIQNTD